MTGGGAASAPAHGTGGRGDARAVHGVMAALAWLPRLLALHTTWLLLTLCGGVVGGIAPATTTLVAVLRGDVRDADANGGPAGAARAVLGRFRADLGPANRAVAPFLVIALAAGANLALGLAGALPGWFVPGGLFAAGILLAVGVLAMAHAIALHVLRPEAPAPMLWRGALGGIVLLPLATASWTITMVAAAIVSMIIQPVGLMLGGGILVFVTSFVLVRTWQARLDAATT